MSEIEDILNEIIEKTNNNNNLATESSFSTVGGFELMQRQAACLAESKMIPDNYHKNVPNIVIALEMSNRLKISPMAVMQHLYIVYGKPSWSSAFIIAQINSCARFKGGLRFEFTGEPERDNRTCFAYIKDVDGEKIVGPSIAIATAKSQGWWGKKGSKWPDLSELMLSYRAAAFFGRLYVPELIMGMQAVEEVKDSDIENMENQGSTFDIESLKKAEDLKPEPAEPEQTEPKTAAEVLTEASK